jgi:hypothetical protein
LTTEPESPTSVRSALTPEALRAAMVPRRPVFANPWDSPDDMFACYVAVAVIGPLLLWAGGALMSAIFGFGSHWPVGVFMVAALVGAAGFMTIVGRERTSLAVDFLAIAAWFLLGLVVAPLVGLAPPALVAIIVYAVMLAAIFGFVLSFGRWQTEFVRTLSWPVTWSLLALLFAWITYETIIYGG